jgi:hypothetical protein
LALLPVFLPLVELLVEMAFELHHPYLALA